MFGNDDGGRGGTWMLDLGTLRELGPLVQQSKISRSCDFS